MSQTKVLATLKKTDLETFKFASKDDTRRMLTMVLVRYKDGMLELCATDSYRLVIRRVKMNDPRPFRPFLISAKALESAAKVMGRVENPFHIGRGAATMLENISIHRDKLVLARGIEFAISHEELDVEKYPNLDKVLTDNDSHGSPVTMNAKYIAEVAKFVGNTGEHVKVTVHGVLQPVFFESSTTLGVVMPIKS